VKRGGAHRVLVFLPPRELELGDADRAPLGAATVVDYAAIDASKGRCSAGDAPLSLLAKAAAVDVLFDVADVFTAQVDAPPMAEGRLRQALPGLIEERLLTDAADGHLAYRIEGTERNPTRVAVAAIDGVTLTRALEAAADAGVQPRSAYSAMYSIPAPAAATLSVRVSRGRGTVRTAEHTGFAFDLKQGAPAALAIAVMQLGIKRVRIYGRDARRLVPLLAPLRVSVIVSKRDVDAGSIAKAVNVLQGRFAPASRFGVPAAAAALVGGGQWKPLLTWAAVGLAVGVVGLNAVRFKLEAQTHAVRSAMQTAFRSAFPSEAVVEPLTQAQRHLRELRARAGQAAADDFSQLNARAAQLLSTAPVGALAGVEYRDAALTLKFKPGAAQSAQFRNALQAQGAQQGLNVRFDSDGSAHIVPTTP
jgi:general secretion pathway protein L